MLDENVGPSIGRNSFTALEVSDIQTDHGISSAGLGTGELGILNFHQNPSQDQKFKQICVSFCVKWL